MKKWIWLVLLSCCSVQADMLDALKAYEQKDYSAAQQQFAELLPLGNELAAFNLGAMAYQGEGQSQDLVKAAAYFMLAAELEHPQAADILEGLSEKISPAQQKEALAILEGLQRRLVIAQSRPAGEATLLAPEPIKRVSPEYPTDAARRGLFGYVKIRFLVNELGDVTAVDTLDAYPQDVFEKVSVRAVKRWKYEPAGHKHLLNVRLDYSLSGGVKVSAVEDVMNELKLWQYAVAGAPTYQFALGTLLSLLEVQSHNGFWHDPDMPLSATPDLSIYDKRAHLRADIDGFWGYVVARVNKDGIITEQLHTAFEDRNQVSSLVGIKLRGDVEADVYRITRQSDFKDKKIRIIPSIAVPRSMSGKFWWEQAAKNGNPDAQRVMAAYDSQWEDYLLSKNDAEVMAWAGTRMIIDGQREQGMALLEQAIAKNYQPAKEMKQQFM